VLAVYDLDTRTLRNFGLAVADLRLGGDQLAFRVPETLQGSVDANGDGDRNDAILWVHDVRSGLTRSTGRAAEASYGVRSDVAVFAVREDFATGTDLNGDGDSFDVVAHAFGFLSDQVLNLGVSLSSFAQLETSLSRLRQAFLAGDGSILVFARFQEIGRPR
jgi:hypothetical protein